MDNLRYFRFIDNKVYYEVEKDIEENVEDVIDIRWIKNYDLFIADNNSDKKVNILVNSELANF